MEAAEKLREYGPTGDHLLKNGALLQVFTSHALPLFHLIEENWDDIDSCGHFRSVRHVVSLKDGSPARLYAKSAERTFTADPINLAKGKFWWGGSRSREKSIFLPNQPLVEERTVWEAVYLLELGHLGVPAEKPLALVTHANGNKELLIADVGASRFANCWSSEDKLHGVLANAGFLPDDLQALFKDDGEYHIIDVNRWEWAPFTNSSRENLIQLIRSQTGQ